MSSLSSTDSRKGQGLEVLDVGSCSLADTALAVLKKAQMTNLRSLTLHHNPLARSMPNYAEELQGLSGLPKLAIIDNKRVVERVKKPESEKKKNKGVKGKASGANVDSTTKMRTWGEKVEGGSHEASPEAPVVTDGVKADKKEKKRKREDDTAAAEKSKTKGEKGSRREAEADKPEKRSKTTDKASKAAPPRPAVAAAVPAPTIPVKDAIKTADPSALSANAKKHSKNETGVYGVVDVVAPSAEKSKNKVKKEKRKENGGGADGAKSDGGIDLKKMFGTSETVLGGGGW